MLMRMRNNNLVIILLALASVCASQWMQGNEDQHARKLLQTEESVDVFLSLGMTSSDCDSQEEFGVNRFVQEWNDAMQCARCSKIQVISSCVPNPVLSFRIRNRGISVDQLQRLINTLVVDTDCVLQRFSSFGKIELNVTRDTSPVLDIPSTSIRQNYNATKYPLLSYCKYEVEPSGQVSDNSNGTVTFKEGGDNLIQIDVEFEVDDALRGEQSDAGEEPLFFDEEKPDIISLPPPPSPPPPAPISSPPSPHPPSPFLSPPPPSPAPPETLEVATIPSDSTSQIPSVVDFNLMNRDMNCKLVNEAIDAANVSEIEQNIGCVGCIQFDSCESGMGINGSIALDSAATPNVTNIFIISFWRELICAVVDSQQNAEIAFGYLPQPLEIPNWNSTDDAQCDGTIASQRKSLNPEPSRVPIESPSYIIPEGIVPNDQNQDGGDGDSDGGSKFPLWILFLTIALLVIPAVLLVLFILRWRKNNNDAGVVAYPISPSPIATPISSAGRQAALLARAEQFGYTPTFR